MKKTKTNQQKSKSFDTKKKGNLKEKSKVYGKKELQKNKIKKSEKSPIDATLLFEKSSKKLESENIYLLELKLALLKKDKHIYVVIHKKPDVSHKDCIMVTKEIQAIIKEEGFDEDDYGVTVSSAGFSWIFKSDKEYSIFEGNNIKIKYFINENTDENNSVKNTATEKGILKENKESLIIFLREDGKKIEIKKENIIKAKLNN